MIVHRASLHRNLPARQPDLVVPGKRTVLIVEPCIIELRAQVFLLRIIRPNVTCHDEADGQQFVRHLCILHQDE
jgi:hypothetical protein